MRKNRIAILFSHIEEGVPGFTKERLDKEIYYKDVDSVKNALSESGFIVNKFSVTNDIEKLLSDIKIFSPDCIFNLCEEVGGDSRGEVYTAGLLELLNIPYTGTGPFGLALALDKARTKDILKSHGLKVPCYQVLNSAKDILSRGCRFPLIIKPLCEDGSYGIETDSIVRDKEGLCKKVDEINTRFKEPVIAEQYIDGRELNVSLLGNKKDSEILAVSEIDYKRVSKKTPKICSYEAKWDVDSSEYKNTMPICPAFLTKQLKNEIEDISRKVYDIMECRDYARIDIRLDKNEIPYIIDVNPNPCLGADSGFVTAAEKAGLAYNNLLARIIEICLKRRENLQQRSGRCSLKTGKG